eukprot:COSAG02_NODE_11544_length_1702_cov_1.430443_2_plen_138_part_00
MPRYAILKFGRGRIRFCNANCMLTIQIRVCMHFLWVTCWVRARVSWMVAWIRYFLGCFSGFYFLFKRGGMRLCRRGRVVAWRLSHLAPLVLLFLVLAAVPGVHAAAHGVADASAAERRRWAACVAGVTLGALCARLG